MSSKLDSGQIFQDIHDDAADAIQVKSIGGTFLSTPSFSVAMKRL